MNGAQFATVAREVSDDAATSETGGDLGWIPVTAFVSPAKEEIETLGVGELTSVIQSELEGPILGESTYGLGAEAKLFELDNGAGLVVSSALWETASGTRWNGDGVVPDEEIRGTGQDYETMSANQLERALEWLAGSLEVEEGRKIAA